MDHTIAIVGAGPAGLRTATRLAEDGWQATVFEEHAKIGEPVNCSGLISKKNADKLNFDTSDALINLIKGARIFSPNKTMLEIRKPSTVAYLVDRAKLDQGFLRQATKAKVNVQTNTKVLDVRKNTLFTQVGERGGMEKAQIVIGADGPASKIRKIMGITVPGEHFVQSIQIMGQSKNEFEKDMVELHFGDYSKGLFAWIIPESKNRAKIGLGANYNINLNDALKSFLKERNIDFQEDCKAFFPIPVAPPLKNPVKENMLLVGDAGLQVKATTGGGIITGCMAAEAASFTISQHLKTNKPLTDYGTYLKPLNKELEIHWKIREYINSLSNDQMDRLLLKAKKSGVEDFLSREGDMDEPSLFVGKLMRQPRMLFMIPELAKFAFS